VIKLTQAGYDKAVYIRADQITWITSGFVSQDAIGTPTIGVSREVTVVQVGSHRFNVTESPDEVYRLVAEEEARQAATPCKAVLGLALDRPT
jgi:hypothetical protein